LFEVGSDSEDFVNQILDTLDAVFSQVVGDEGVVCQGNALSVDFSITTFVDEVADRLEVGLAICDVWLDDLEHLLRGLGEFDKDTVVDLDKSKELHDLSGFGSHFVDTSNVNHKVWDDTP
jgi:hypothetical protein